jgi:predicted nucleic acid-binding protein
VDGRERICTVVAVLIDTNVLVYVFDHRFPQKQRVAQGLLQRGIAAGGMLLPHQAIVEFIAVVTRPTKQGPPLLEAGDALREAESLVDQLPVLYPHEGLVRTAIDGATRYQLSWFDAHLWAYAKAYGLSVLISEDFQHGRKYGGVQVVNPFLDETA